MVAVLSEWWLVSTTVGTSLHVHVVHIDKIIIQCICIFKYLCNYVH